MKNLKTNGFSYVVFAYILWGILPVYWKLVQHVTAIEILANRLVWSFLFMLGIVLYTKQKSAFVQVLKDKKQMLLLAAAGVLITINWGTYIYAVNVNRIIEASLGYFIAPLFMVALGVFLFKESLTKLQIVALVLALIGVSIKTIQYGQIPWIALGLALSFSFYSSIKKSIKTNATIGLTMETLVMTPIALIYLVFLATNNNNAFQTETLSTIALLIGAGIATAVPLLLFGIGAKKVSMVLIGFAQYIGPTLSLFLGIFIYQETFGTYDFIAFSFIWVAIVLYSYTQFKQKRTVSKKIFQEEVLQEL